MWRLAGGRCLRTAAAAAHEHALAARGSTGVWYLQRLVCSALECGNLGSVQPSPSRGPSARGFAAPAAADDDEEQREVGNDNVRRLAEEVMQLSLLEVSDLTEILSKRLKLQQPSMGMAYGGQMMGGGMPAAAPAAPVEAAPVAVEKTEFDIKLTGFDAASKVKVIKEVRTMTSLGLKEAKELVEKAPTVIKSGVKKEEAEELQKKLEAVGGKISLE